MIKEDNSPKYPIYIIIAKWTELYDGDRRSNSTSFSHMFKEQQTDEQLDEFVKNWWEIYKADEKYIGREMKIDTLEWKYKEDESWVLTWFSHQTFDVGQTDKEVLDSFEHFVRRKEDLNEKSQYKYGDDTYCLMGAEDRWRWHGADSSGFSGSHTAPPCRCVHCKEQGLIRIGH